MHSPVENNVKCYHMPTEKKVTHNVVETAQQETASQVSTLTGCHRPLRVAIPSLSEPVRLRPIVMVTVVATVPVGQVFLCGN